MNDELAALAALSEQEELRGNKLVKLYQKTENFSQILRAYNRSIDPDKISVQYQDRGVQLLPFWDKSYPDYLREVIGKPLLLYVKGNTEVLRQPMMAVVGSRTNDKNKREVIEKLIGGLVSQGYAIVSGLARGTDTLVHQITMDLGGKTVAVLAHGLDKVYPPENADLAKKIVVTGGALISEMPWQAKIERRYFLARNRIVVGMSQGLVVIEAGIQSGSIASANWAAEMGREVFAVPGSPGTNLLIEEGANSVNF